MKSLILLTIVLLYGSAECQNISSVLEDLNCNLLLEALTNSGLINTLDQLEDVTLFAPTDQAIDVAGGLESLEHLLEYHATDTIVNSTAIENELLVVSLTGSEIRFNIYNDGQIYTAQGSPIDMNQVDQKVTNGTIHVINAVMTPPTGTLYEYLSSNSTFSTLITAIDKLNLTEELNGTGSYTGFAPTNAAFNLIPSTELEAMMDNTTYLASIITYHGAEATRYSADLNNGDNILTYRGDNLTIDVSDNVISLKEEGYATIIEADVSVTNGVIHVIDRVLDMPGRVSGSSVLSLHTSMALACLALAVSALNW